jgi:Zn-dependent peptidase ImmA (M78 family)
MPPCLKTPQQILAELGINQPEDLDVEAIAEYCGATIRYKPLSDCEARIIGFHNRAIITVNTSSSRGRQRFSGGHELGHWMCDRGKVAFRCEYETYLKGWRADNAETRANRFASDLLLPTSMFVPRARGLPVILQTARQLAIIFSTSLTSTLIRLVEHGGLPSMLVYTTPQKREWFVASAEVEGRLWPLSRPGGGSLAASLFNSKSQEKGPKDIRCDNWINHPRADQYWVKENSLSLQDGSVLSLLWWEDEQQITDLDEYEDQIGTRRSDGRTNWD